MEKKDRPIIQILFILFRYFIYYIIAKFLNSNLVENWVFSSNNEIIEKAYILIYLFYILYLLRNNKLSQFIRLCTELTTYFKDTGAFDDLKETKAYKKYDDLKKEYDLVKLIQAKKGIINTEDNSTKKEPHNTNTSSKNW